MIDVFEPGYLSDLTDKAMMGGKFNKLTIDNMFRVVEMFSSIKDTHVLDIDNKSGYRTESGKVAFGYDLKNIAMLMYSKPRGHYMLFDGNQSSDTTLGAGVPIPLLAAKNYFHKKYMQAYMDFQDKDIKYDNITSIFRLDMLLGNAFRSTEVNDKGEIVLLNKTGLFTTPKHEFTIGEVRKLREQCLTRGIRGYGTKMYKSDEDFAKVFNGANNFIRHMITQSWIWHSEYRNSDMIMCLTDWDRKTKDVDSTLEGLEAAPVVEKGYKGVFGL